MTSNLEKDTQLPEGTNPQRETAIQARDLFVDASIKNPASVTGQAARIAKACIELRVKPHLLGEGLLKENDLIDEIQTRGNVAHSGNRVRSITAYRLMDIILSDFTLAQRFIALDDIELEGLYIPFQGKPTSIEEETTLIEKAKRLVELKGLRESYVNEDAEKFG